MALGDGDTWDEASPTNATVATAIDDYNRDLRVGIRSRMALEHEWPDSQSATSEAGVHKFITLQQQAAAPTLSGTQVGSVYLDTNDVIHLETAGGDVPMQRIVQIVNVQDGEVDTGTTQIPLDDSIPQITEGDEYMTLAITPTSATNKLRIEVIAHATGGESSSAFITMALFQDTTANALAAVINTTEWNTSGSLNQFTLSHYMTAGTTSETTFRIRIGNAVVSTTTFNGDAGSRQMGGVLSSSITITEIGV